ncbi:hypothetical protein QYF61_005766 [Mycteria americana]|uniref:Uncharacterized protein n=1 Tax=Mycteria americana TaxID=33587 RepID=A0AAN7S0G2_MYCAM|nr:hypothetical protein QYF61_005766 [Mycteria americana]
MGRFAPFKSPADWASERNKNGFSPWGELGYDNVKWCNTYELEIKANKPYGYTWEAIDADKHVLYKINFCFGVEECGRSSAVCAYDINKKTYLSVDLKSESNMLANLSFHWQTALMRSYESSIKVFELELLEDGEEEDDSHLYADAQQLISLHSPYPSPLTVEAMPVKWLCPGTNEFFIK